MRQEVEYIPPETSPKLMPTPFLLSGRLILQLHPKHMWWNVLWLIGKENSRNPALSPSAKGGGKKLSVGAGCNGGKGCISQRLTDSYKGAKRASPFLGWLAPCSTSSQLSVNEEGWWDESKWRSKGRKEVMAQSVLWYPIQQKDPRFYHYLRGLSEPRRLE